MDEKLHTFIRAALSNPRHPLFRLNQAPVLRHYALNVQGAGLLEAMTPDQWEKDFPQHAATIRECMQILEKPEEPPAPAPPPAVPAPAPDTKMQEALDALATKVAALEAQIKDAAPPKES